MLLTLLIELLANRFSPRRVMIIGVILYGVHTLTVPQYVHSEGALLIALLIGRATWAFIFVNSLLPVMNTDSGNNFGAFADLYFLAFQAASVVGPLLSGVLI